MEKINKVAINNLETIKQNNITQLMATTIIQEALSKYRLTRGDIENNWIEFINYHDDHKQCIGCTGLDKCPKASKGYVYQIESDQNRNVKLIATPCRFGKILQQQYAILSNVLVSNIDKKIILTRAKDIDLSQNEKLKEIYVAFNQNINAGRKKGMFIKAPMSKEKLLVLGSIARTYALDHKIGFINFPNFIIDLKGRMASNDYLDSLNSIKTVEYLFLDDIGNEYVTNWSRDEILFSIIAYRLQNDLVTYISSEYDLKQLAKYYTIRSGDEYRVKSLIEKMKALCDT
ncbi:MAG: hypothetical protein PHI41_03205 [Erysipelotrichaceae bacterium]|nr:hypothetical protein [Erysipelotrichaceae bacterium]